MNPANTQTIHRGSPRKYWIGTILGDTLYFPATHLPTGQDIQNLAELYSNNSDSILWANSRLKKRDTVSVFATNGITVHVMVSNIDFLKDDGYNGFCEYAYKGQLSTKGTLGRNCIVILGIIKNDRRYRMIQKEKATGADSIAASRWLDNYIVSAYKDDLKKGIKPVQKNVLRIISGADRDTVFFAYGAWEQQPDIIEAGLIGIGKIRNNKFKASYIDHYINPKDTGEGWRSFSLGEIYGVDVGKLAIILYRGYHEWCEKELYIYDSSTEEMSCDSLAVGVHNR